MIKVGTVLKACDNSGAIRIKCIKILKKRNLGSGQIGDILLVVVKKVKKTSKIKEKTIQKCMLVRYKQAILDKNGNYIKFYDNAAVLLNNKLQPIGTRIFGPVSQLIKKTKNIKLITLCPRIL